MPEGIQTSDGKVHEADVIILAVGFDARLRRSQPHRHPRPRRPLVEGRMEGRDPHRDGAAGARLSRPIHHWRAARSVRGAVQHDDLPAAAGRLDHRVHRLCEEERQAGRRGDQGVRGQLGQAPRRNRGRDPGCENGLLVYGLDIDGKTRRLLAYIGGVGNYNKQCDELAANGYQGFAMT